MSRSNPTVNSPHPCTRWFEWSGGDGEVRYYDREKKENLTVADGFTFVVLDELATVKGWHDQSDSGITSNEVRDTKKETLLVRAFKGGKLAEGFYSAIRDRVISQGGHYTSNIYLGYRGPSGLLLGSLQLKGAALNVWVEFKKKHRAELYSKAVKIKGFVQGKKGKIDFRTPVFHLVDISAEADESAKALDIQLQEYLKGYFERTRNEQVAGSAPAPGVGEAPQDDAHESSIQPDPDDVFAESQASFPAAAAPVSRSAGPVKKERPPVATTPPMLDESGEEVF